MSKDDESVLSGADILFIISGLGKRFKHTLLTKDRLKLLYGLDHYKSAIHIPIVVHNAGIDVAENTKFYKRNLYVLNDFVKSLFKLMPDLGDRVLWTPTLARFERGENKGQEVYWLLLRLITGEVVKFRLVYTKKDQVKPLKYQFSKLEVSVKTADNATKYTVTDLANLESVLKAVMFIK